MSYIDDARHALEEELAARGANDLQPALIDLYTLLVLTCGELTDLDEVHDAAAVWIARLNPGQRSIVKFDDVSSEAQQRHEPYRDAIRAAADRIQPPEDGPEIRVRAFVRFEMEHPDVDLGPERELRPQLVLRRGPSGRHLDIPATIPALLREAADGLEALHLPADRAAAGGER